MKKFFLMALALTAMVSCQQPQNESKGSVEVKEEKNEVVDAMMSRRSIRSYKPEQITDAQLDTIIECAINAPSAMNRQAWEVRVIQDPAMLKAINDGFVQYAKGKNMQGSASKSEEPEFSVFHGSPTLIVVASQKGNGSSQVDCGLLGQNILLAAESMNIGTCVVGSVIAYLSTPEAKDLVSKMNFSEGFEPLYSISVGYKNESPDAKPRDKSKVQVIK